MAKTGMHLQGAKELQQLLLQVGPAIAKRAGVAGVRKGATVFRKELKEASPVQTGRLKKQWRYRKMRSRKNTYIAYAINLRGYQFYNTLEYGNKRVRYPTHPFALRTMEAAAAQALARMMAGTKTAVSFEAGKAYQRSVRLGR